MNVLSGKLKIGSDLQAARELENWLLGQLVCQGYGEAAAFAVKLALEEGLNNAIKHGNHYDGAKTIEVGYELDDRHVAISIADQGNGFDPSAVPDPTADENLEKPSGRGIMLMRAYMDEVRYNPQGNQLFLLKRNT